MTTPFDKARSELDKKISQFAAELDAEKGIQVELGKKKTKRGETLFGVLDQALALYTACQSSDEGRAYLKTLLEEFGVSDSKSNNDFNSVARYIWLRRFKKAKWEQLDKGEQTTAMVSSNSYATVMHRAVKEGAPVKVLCERKYDVEDKFGQVKPKAGLAACVQNWKRSAAYRAEFETEKARREKHKEGYAALLEKPRFPDMPRLDLDGDLPALIPAIIRIEKDGTPSFVTYLDELPVDVVGRIWEQFAPERAARKNGKAPDNTADAAFQFFADLEAHLRPIKDDDRGLVFFNVGEGTATVVFTNIVADDGKVRSPIAKLTFKSFAWMQDGVLLLTAADLKAIGSIKALEGWNKVGSMSGVGALLIGQSYADWEDAWRKSTNEAKDKRYAAELEKFRNGQRKKEPELKYVAEYEFKAGITHERAEDGFVSHTFRSGITRIGLPTSTFSPIYSTILDAEAINVWGDWERLRNEGDYRVMISGNELRWALLDNKAISNLTIELPDTFEAAAKIELLVKGGDFLSTIQFLLGTTDKVDECRIEFAFNPDAALFRLDLGGEVREMLVPLLNDNGKDRNTNEVNIMLAEITPARDDLFTKVEKGKGDPEELFKRFAERGSATIALPA